MLCGVVIEVSALPPGDALLRHQGFRDLRASRVRTASVLTVLSAATQEVADEDVCRQFSSLTVEQPNQGLSVSERVVDRMVIVLVGGTSRMRWRGHQGTGMQRRRPTRD